MKMTFSYAYFRKIGKINISNTVFKTTKGTEVYTCWQAIPHTKNSLGKKTCSEYCCCYVIYIVCKYVLSEFYRISKK